MSRVLRACTKTGTSLATAGIAALTTGVLATPAAADPSGHNPPGHNGDIKIIAVDDLSSPPENNPMQGCTLAIEWYGLDEGDLLSQVAFETISPTGDAELTVLGPLEVQVGEDAAGGGNDLDAREEYTFAVTGDPGPHGFHVKVTVQTPGRHGPEKKSKVFWIADCPVEEPPVEEPPVEEPPVEEPPVEEPPVEEPPVEEPPVEEPPVEEPVVDPEHPETVLVDPVLDPAPVPVPAAAAQVDVPNLVDAGTSAQDPGDDTTRHGLVILGGLLLTSVVLLRRASRGFRG